MFVACGSSVAPGLAGQTASGRTPRLTARTARLTAWTARLTAGMARLTTRTVR